MRVGDMDVVARDLPLPSERRAPSSAWAPRGLLGCASGMAEMAKLQGGRLLYYWPSRG